MAGGDNAQKKEGGGRATMSIISDAILAETIKKELRNFKINEEYMLSPTAIKNLVLANKPTDSVPLLSKTSKLADVKPVGTHGPLEIPKTTSAIYGWDTVPLVKFTDRRFHHPKTETEITKMYGTPLVPKDPSEKSGGKA
ncbi:hypothetical protein BC833DRAFT_651520 [Globomyces pollinis-pini]|nr:hypothetical protein BC833DRAFT_651520 [Globomyces pollinis-pini]KAJ2995930.1 hypothetical protein HDV02_000281 [Globomyces sp. JEL0801]